MLADALVVKELGNNFFKEGQYQFAIEKYTEALKICPIIDLKSRAILYSNRSASFLKMVI
jgi:tetratricopeptide (TPR) repeat protein